MPHTHNIRRALIEYKVPARGLLQIAGFYGAEFPVYYAMGFQHLVAFEPQDNRFTEMLVNGHPPSDCQFEAFNVALGDVAAVLPLHIEVEPEHGAASFLNLHGHPPGTHQVARSVPCQVVRFDSLPEAASIVSKCNWIVLDVEGYELKVLNGMGQYFNSSFDALCVEVNRGGCAPGAPTTAEMIAYLGAYGFAPIDPEPDLQWDMVFVHGRFL